MTSWLSRILLCIIFSVAIGMGNIDVFVGSEPVDNCFCLSQGEMEDDLCFDVLVNSIHLDIISDIPSWELILSETVFCWGEDVSDGRVSAAMVTLPLRAPPTNC